MTRSSLLSPLVLLVVRKEGVWRSRFERSAEKVAPAKEKWAGVSQALKKLCTRYLECPDELEQRKKGSGRVSMLTDQIAEACKQIAREHDGQISRAVIIHQLRAKLPGVTLPADSTLCPRPKRTLFTVLSVLSISAACLTTSHTFASYANSHPDDLILTTWAPT